MAFFEAHHAVKEVNMQDMFMMGRMMEKLRVQGQPLPGGLHGLERGDGTVPIGRKRSIHSISPYEDR